ncbi:hypothetical protein P7K49_017664 [Saguinus oedipus]|uniref:Uncharacterized protein n=1 Tax=Saguinus oedipus TaxID=9490 RepID=A0ABQ9V521_SAGOE|nr:hypothetical protein P7K49_017664 [Saguinus oedipus]
MAVFEFNGQSGYLLKHEFMRRPDKQFNPFSVDRIDVVVATTLSITARPWGRHMAEVLSRRAQEPTPPSTPNPLPDILEISAPASSCSSKLPWKLPPPQHWRLPLGPHGNQREGLRLRSGREFDAGSPRPLYSQVISGQFLSERSVRTYVEVELFGLPGDPKRRYRTKLSPSTNSINPVWKEAPFVFEKILMPELASLRVAVMEEGNKFLGHRIIPINALNSGYHHLCLRSESNMPLTMPALFVYLEMKDYVPGAWADLTVALANPIKFFNAHDKKSVKLKEAMGGLPECRESEGQGAQLRLPRGAWGRRTEPRGPPKHLPAQSVAFAAARVGAREEAMKAAAGWTGREAWSVARLTPASAEPRTASLEELRELKGVVKLQRRHEKELQELERRGTRRWEELLQRGVAQLAELGPPGAGGLSQEEVRTLAAEYPGPCPHVASSPGACPAGRAPELRRARALRVWRRGLELELLRLGEEQFECWPR